MKKTDIKPQKVGAVLVLGGGIGGVQASLDLAEAGYRVYLVEKFPSIAGVMGQLDKTFPTNDCSMCILAPKLVEAGRHPNIELLTYAELEEVEGEAGDFAVSIKKKPRYVDENKCTGCGQCTEKCPVRIPDLYNEELCQTKSIRVPFPQAVPALALIDPQKCIFLTKGKCRACEKVCTAGAIDFSQREKILAINVGAIILAPGFDEFDPRLKPEYGYGRYPNVYTSIEFERMTNASGPFLGHFKRRSDEKVPHKIAYIQCVGSRDTALDRGYCSSVCCMYATKESIIAKEHNPDLDITIFYMDLRAYGKDFDRYIERAKSEYGIKYIRSSVSEVAENPETKNLIIKYETEEGKIDLEEFDMLVLSVGLDKLREADDLRKKLGVDLNRYRFCKTKFFDPVQTTKEGIFVCGAFQGPKDIPETVIQASGAAAKASSLLAESRGSLAVKREYPSEIEIGEEVRIGAFICHCGINIAGVVDVQKVVEGIKRLPHVVYAERNMYTCSQDTQVSIREKIKEHNLNRIVVAACTPRTHEPLFQETCRQTGLNPYLFSMANIRDHCSWVHMKEKDAATQKALDLTKMAIARARLLKPLKPARIKVTPVGLVIGAGIAGMTAALELAAQGFTVHLVEKEKELGGHLKHVYYLLTGDDPQEKLGETIKKVMENERIEVHLASRITQVSGYIGNYKVQISPTRNQTIEAKEIEAGIIIVATGAREYLPTEYLYGQDERVITQSQLEKSLSIPKSGIQNLKTIVMIQCVGSRDDERPYCSRICCGVAIKNALRIKEVSPKANVCILYKDIRTYGFKEDYYREARQKGIIFIHYEDTAKPEVSVESGQLKVLVQDRLLGTRLEFNPELLVLSTGLIPHSDNKELASMLKVPLNQDGFFLEAHVKLRPVEFATDGIFLCGGAHCPKGIDEAIAQAQGAASRASIPLAAGEIRTEPIVSWVDQDKCTGCGLCESICPYNAIQVELTDEGRKAKTVEASCKGCGLCGASCPQQAITMNHFSNEQILTPIEELG
jgi:heterodisulfide reductase subunit A